MLDGHQLLSYTEAARATFMLFLGERGRTFGSGPCEPRAAGPQKGETLECWQASRVSRKLRPSGEDRRPLRHCARDRRHMPTPLEVPLTAFRVGARKGAPGSGRSGEAATSGEPPIAAPRGESRDRVGSG